MTIVLLGNGINHHVRYTGVLGTFSVLLAGALRHHLEFSDLHKHTIPRDPRSTHWEPQRKRKEARLWDSLSAAQLSRPALAYGSTENVLVRVGFGAWRKWYHLVVILKILGALGLFFIRIEKLSMVGFVLCSGHTKLRSTVEAMTLCVCCDVTCELCTRNVMSENLCKE